MRIRFVKCNHKKGSKKCTRPRNHTGQHFYGLTGRTKVKQGLRLI